MNGFTDDHRTYRQVGASNPTQTQSLINLNLYKYWPTLCKPAIYPEWENQINSISFLCGAQKVLNPALF
jgi:hypothetical protein